MAKVYKVWIEIEEIDEEDDHFETVQQNEFDEFTTLEEAEACFDGIFRRIS